MSPRVVVEDRGYLTPCYVWQGATAGAGYGVCSRGGRQVYVHRDAWEEEQGPVPDGLKVLHKCDVPPCRNVEHLFLGTQADNVADCIAKGRAVPPPVLRGSRNGRARLDDERAAAIRVANGSQREIARRFGVSQKTVWRVRSAGAWA